MVRTTEAKCLSATAHDARAGNRCTQNVGRNETQIRRYRLANRYTFFSPRLMTFSIDFRNSRLPMHLVVNELSNSYIDNQTSSASEPIDFWEGTVAKYERVLILAIAKQAPRA